MTEHIDITDKKALFRDFIFCVRKMRDCQRRYFQSRNRDAMIESKQWENKVDNILAAIDLSQKKELPLDI